jgi:hypothetical protein
VFLETISSFPTPAQVGDRVRVIYDPKDPADAKLDRFGNRHLGEMVLLVFGLVGTLIYAFDHSHK